MSNVCFFGIIKFWKGSHSIDEVIQFLTTYSASNLFEFYKFFFTC